jgi:two-component system sensor histidine kinase GlrK
MRISTKIIAGYALLIGIMASLATCQVVSARKTESIVTSLTSADFRSGRLSLELIRDREMIEEYARKAFALGDPDYATRLQISIDSFNRVLAELRASVRSPEAVQRLAAVLPHWAACAGQLASSLEGPAEIWPRDIPPQLESSLGQLKAGVEDLYQVILRGIDSEVQSSHRTTRGMELASLYATGFALMLSSVISVLIVRSITKPLRQLTDGTRAVAEGRFGSQLDVATDYEFAELARDFNSMMQRLGELDTLKKDFLSHVSHELKSPLASMQDNLRLLLDQVPGTLTDKQRRLLSLNLQSARRLSEMIFNLLDISRMEAGALRYEMKRHNLSELVRTAVAEIEAKTGEQRLGIRINVPESLPLECDHNRILQVLVNLLDNAIKFSPAGATIEVSAGPITEIMAGMPSFARASYNEYTMVSVADQGPGVPDVLKGKIFEKFQQAGKTGKMAGEGVGLGLAIARTIVEAHRGAIWVQDNPGGGSRFIVLLPLQSKEVRAVSAPI